MSRVLVKATLDHAQPSKVKRSDSLRVVLEPLSLPPDWEIKAGVPATRGDCVAGPRPCPYLSCRHHLWLVLQQDQAGNWQKGRHGETGFRPSTNETCALDVAERGAPSEEVGRLLGMDATRVRQLAAGALKKLLKRGVRVEELLRVMAREQ